jgi:hypothetical protein
MPKLWIANTTKQHHHLYFRLPGRGDGLRRIIIKAGKQECIDDDLTMDEVNSVIKQYERYAITDAREYTRRKGRVWLVYSIDKPVNIDQMLQTFDGNDKEMEKEAFDRQVRQAAAVQDGIAENLHQLTGIDKEALRPSVEVETVEETDDGRPSIAMGVEVPRNPDAPPTKARSKATVSR